MSFNLFGPATICDIKVGYISTDRGYVDGLSRYEANKYAQLNPGTQFIFKNRDIIRYLNINEVNQLTPDDLLPNRVPTNGCDQESVNTFGLDIYNPDGSLKPDATGTPGTPRVYINGGGGVGAAANAVIGNDGSLLAVDVVDGGYGYRYEPQIDIVDLEGLGSGAVAIASLCPPDRVGTLQTFENEEDFEEYDLRTCAPAPVDFGRRVGADGEDIGEWDPSIYASLRVDPIRREIIAYQEFLDSLREGWWNTRKAKPIEIIADDKKGNVKYDVQHWAWGGSRDVKKIESKKENFSEVEFKVYTQGGQDRGLMFTFVEKNGDHRFKIKADSFPDGAKGQKVKIKVKANSVYTVNASGRFRGKGVEQGLLKNFGRKGKELDRRFTDGKRIFADFVKSSNDNDDLQIEATQGKFKTDNRRKLDGHSTYDLTYQLQDSGQFRAETKVIKKIDDSFMNRFAISPVPPSNVPGSDFAGIQYSFIYEENFPYDGEYTFKAMADNVGEVYVDNESIFQFRRFKGGPDVVKRNIKAGVHKIRCDLFNAPQKVKVKSVQPSPQPPTTTGPGELLIDYRGMSEGAGIKRRSNTKVTIDDDVNPKFDENARFEIKSSTVNARFSDDGKKLLFDGSGSVTIRFTYDDDPNTSGLAVTDIEVGGTVWKRKFDNIFNASGKSRFQGRPAYTKRYEERGSVTKTIKVSGPKTSSTGDRPARPSGKSTVSTSDQPSEIFNTLDYINRANRKLFRINSNAGKDSDFLNRFGVLPFNPAAVEREEVLVPVKSPSQAKPQASIVREGDRLFLKVTGGGRIKVDFRLKVDDNLYTSGVFAREIVIKTDDNDLKLQRDIREVRSGRGSFTTGKKKETITGSGIFTGGKTYPIKVIGGSPTSGFKPIDKTTVGFDDDIKNGYDENGLLRIENVKILQESDARYETKQNQVTKVVKRFPKKPNASTDAYAGIHVILWENVDFPVDGNYNISTMVDDNATIYIGNKDGNGKKAIGNGLRSVEKGGDEVIIKKIGFSQGASTGKSIDTRFFRKGKYRIRVELEQIPGKPLAKGNPMAFAMKIVSSGNEAELISPRSWNENPMGVALKIDPPLPPIPQEPIPRAPGRCPNNPIWSTRFPGGQQSWWPVTHANRDGTKTWSKFMNRFAVSPIPPLSTKGTAGGGIVYSNSWNIEAPYDGFYGMKGTVDNGGRVLVDGKVILQGGGTSFAGSGRTLEGFGSETPQTVKFPLTQGNHTVTVEVENRPQTKQKRIKKTIFNTADWAVQTNPAKLSRTIDIVYKDLHPANKKIRVSADQKEITLKDGDGNDTNSSFKIISGAAIFSKDGKKIIGQGKVRIRLKYKDDPKKFGEAVRRITIGKTKWNRRSDKTRGEETKNVDLGFDSPSGIGLAGGTTKKGVSYSGPELASYRSGSLGPFLTPKFDSDQQYLAEFNGTTWTMKWTGVDFPITGRYRVRSEADDILRLKVDGEFITETKVSEGVREIFFNGSQGKRTVEMELTNIDLQRPFQINPTVFNVIIDTDANITVPAEKAWRDNPVGISAILIPPPCPLETKGLGKLCDILPLQPGNGYAPPPGPGYPVVLEVIRLEPVNPGINYGPDDAICIIKDDGSRVCFPPNLGPFGANLPIDTAPTPVTQYPNVFQSSPTGVNARFRPVVRVRRDPLDVEPEDILQVTDLVGLKRTGYVGGREYFGAVFYKDGVRFAGYYETPGQLIQVYDTLQESIDGEVTTRPSAILRQGTDITSNDPRLNIPGTPENLT